MGVSISNAVSFNDGSVQTTAIVGSKGQVFTSNGTFTIPPGITSVKTTVVGPGGNGGSANGAITFAGAGAGGGGSGATAISFLTGLTPGATLTVIVGTGASNSIVSSGTQSIATITGGAGANASSDNTGKPGDGGTATGGTLNIGGNSGSVGAGEGGTVGAAGGGSILGGGGGARVTAGVGSPGKLYGGGGGGGAGASADDTTYTGGVGAAGVVIFEW